MNQGQAGDITLESLRGSVTFGSKARVLANLSVYADDSVMVSESADINALGKKILIDATNKVHIKRRASLQARYIDLRAPSRNNNNGSGEIRLDDKVRLRTKIRSSLPPEFYFGTEVRLLSAKISIVNASLQATYISLSPTQPFSSISITGRSRFTGDGGVGGLWIDGSNIDTSGLIYSPSDFGSINIGG